MIVKRLGTHLGLCALGLSLLSWTAGCLGDDCDDVWKPDIRRGPICADSANRCAQLANQPDRTLGFVINLAPANADGKPVSADALAHRASCVRDLLFERGVPRVTVAPDNSNVVATGSLRRVGPALELVSVANFVMSCATEAACADCEAKPVAACQTDAFCETLAGAPLDLARQCLLPEVPLSCAKSGQACDTALTWAASPSGACHLFSSGCLPPGFAAAASCMPPTLPPACTP